VSRVTADTAEQRSRFLAALADFVFVAYADAGSRTEVFCRTLVAWGKPLFVLDSPRNRGVVAVGAQPVSAGSARRAWHP
jgi:hypothetical protein